MRIHWVIFITVVLIGFVSCKNETDRIPPEIVIFSPLDSERFDVLDEVKITADITDDNVIESVRLSLVSDDTKNSVLPVKTFDVGSVTYKLDLNLLIADSLLPTGRYYLKIDAFDGQNTKSAFQYVFINGRSKEKKGVLVATNQISGTAIYKVENDYTYRIIHQFPHSYHSSVFNSKNQDYWFLPSSAKQLSVFNTEKAQTVFSKSYNSIFASPFNLIKSAQKDVRFTVKDFGFEGFNQNYFDNYTFLTSSNTVVESFALGEKFNVVEEVDRSGSNRKIKVLNKSSGAQIRELNFTDDVVDIYFTDENNALLFYNTAFGGGIRNLNIGTPSVQTPLVVTDSIRIVQPTIEGEFILSTSSGVKSYVLRNNNLTSFVSDLNVVLAYDDVNDMLYIGKERELRVYSNRRNTLLNQLSFPTKIVGIDLQYNRY